MSLINDALKRAKAAHTAGPPGAVTASAPLHAAGEDHHRSNEPLLVLLALLILFTVLAGIFALQIKRHRLVDAAAPTPHTAPVVTAPAIPAQTIGSPTQSAAVAPTNTPIAGTLSPEQPPPPAPARLQAIFYDPVRPSAMIGGESMFVGDSLGNFRVAAITRTTVTLVSPTRTNLLTLSVD